MGEFLDRVKSLMPRGYTSRGVELHNLSEQAKVLADEMENPRDLMRAKHRSRHWDRANLNDHDFVKLILGEIKADAVESAARSGKLIADLSAGDLTAAIDLAKKFPQARIVAIEPYLPDSFDNLPNLRVIGKKLEEIAEDDIPTESIAAAYSTRSFAYIQDPLAAIQSTWRMLELGGVAFIDLWQLSMSPLLETVVKRSQLEDVMEVDEVMVLRKKYQAPLAFGPYIAEFDSRGDGFVSTRYKFI